MDRSILRLRKLCRQVIAAEDKRQAWRETGLTEELARKTLERIERANRGH